MRVSKEDPINTLSYRHTSLSTHHFHVALINSNSLVILCEDMHLLWLLRLIPTHIRHRIIVFRASRWEAIPTRRKSIKSLAKFPH
jgi:hypothetical protein